MFEKTIEEIQQSRGYEENKIALIEKKLVEGLPSSIGRQTLEILSREPNGQEPKNILERHLSESEQKGKIGLEKIEERIDAHMYDESKQLVSSLPMYPEDTIIEGEVKDYTISQDSFIKLQELANTYNYADERELLEQDIQPAI